MLACIIHLRRQCSTFRAARRACHAVCKFMPPRELGHVADLFGPPFRAWMRVLALPHAACSYVLVTYFLSHCCKFARHSAVLRAVLMECRPAKKSTMFRAEIRKGKRYRRAFKLEHFVGYVWRWNCWRLRSHEHNQQMWRDEPWLNDMYIHIAMCSVNHVSHTIFADSFGILMAAGRISWLRTYSKRYFILLRSDRS